MNIKKYTPISQLCSHYNVELSFFIELNEYGLIELETMERIQCIHQDEIIHLEKIIRINHELGVNIEGIDVILNLLQKVDNLRGELATTQDRLRLYEND